MGYSKSINRVEIFDELTEEETNQINAIQDLKFIQIKNDISITTLDLLNKIIFGQRKDVQFRVYGFRDKECDLVFLERLNNVVDLSIGEMDAVKNLEILKKLPHLKKLRVSLNKLDNIEFLCDLSDNITELMIGTGINNSKLSIELIERFQKLNTLFLYKINYGFDALTKIKTLNNLIINASNIQDFLFLNETNIDNLALGLINNSCESLSGNSKLKRLDLWKINGLSNLNILANLPSLEYAKISQIGNIQAIPDLKKCINIKTLIFDDLKNLKDILNLSYIPNIEHIEFYRAKYINIDDIETILKKNSTIHYIKCRTGSVRKDIKIKKILAEYGIDAS